jgi:hypothetical protein
MPTIAESLTLVALLAATLQYAILLRRREERRDAVRWQVELNESLVSVGRADPRPMRTWSDDGARFRVER